MHHRGRLGAPAWALRWSWALLAPVLSASVTACGSRHEASGRAAVVTPPFASPDVHASAEPPGAGGAPSYPYALVVYVDAAGLDTRSPTRLLRSLFGWRTVFRRGQGVGHAWLALVSPGDVFVGGHTGEYGIDRAPYAQGVLTAIREGEPDPVAYLWEEMDDGRYHSGSDHHRADRWCRFPLDAKAHARVTACLESYDYDRFALRGHLCTDLVATCAAAAGISLGHEVTLQIPPTVEHHGRELTLWTDPRYASLTIGLPDVLLQSLQLAEARGLCVQTWRPVDPSRASRGASR